MIYNQQIFFWRMILLCLFVLIQIVQGEIIKDPTLCSRTRCKVPYERKFKYQEGVSYQYQYSVDVSTNLGKAGTLPSNGIESKNETKLNIDASLIVYFTSPCEGVLKFQNVSLSHDRNRYNAEFPDRAGADFKASLERYTLRFAFDDGRINEVCPDRRETVWALNLKRGVLSMLQNTMKRFDVDHRVDELDVNGICETNYRLYEARKTQLIIKRTKNLADCQFSSKHLSVMQSNYYKNTRSTTKTSKRSLLKSSTECEITIDHNVYDRVVCKDTHQLRPLSNDNSASARTESIAILQLVEESKEEFYEDEESEEGDNENTSKDIAIRTNLLYDHEKVSKTIHGELRTSRDLLKILCRNGANSDEIQHRFSETFIAFVQSARLLDYPYLSQLFARANSICKTGKKQIVDALPYMGSNAAVNVMKDLIIKKYVNEETTANWITIFGLIPRPNYGTVRALAPLLDFQHQMPNTQFILSYSSVIHTFCKSTNIDCTHLEDITKFMSYLKQKINKGCALRYHPLAEVKETLEALKAIENMGLETDDLSDKLKVCIDNAGGFVTMEVRVAAINAHRRLPSCELTRDRYLLNYYRNFTLDSELRIASYLQIMRCPDYNVIKTIKHTLKVEEVNQVGSFVWSHLTNLYSSSSPTRIEIQSLLTDRDFGNKFNSDIRKFSRNYEGSFFSEEYNFGANHQSNLIFSPKSYIPRTASFNMTIDLLGESVNLFEVSMRMEGLEYYAENLFGPDGPYSNEKVSNHFKNLIRNFRSVPEREDQWSQVKRLPNIIDNNFNDPKISFGYKIFGNELKYTMLNGDKEIKDALASLNPWEKVRKILSGQEIYYDNTVMFLDSTYVVPTTSGLPIRLDLAGSAACKFKLAGFLNISRTTNTKLELIGNFTPSVSVDIVGTMMVDAFYKNAGIKLRTNIYSSGAVQMHFNLDGMRLVQLNLGLPNNKIEIFSIITHVFWVETNGAESEETQLGILKTDRQSASSKELMLPERVISNTTCTWQTLDRLIGLKMCVDYQFPNVTNDPNAPYFLLNGPTLFKVSVIKADPTAKSYLLEYKWVRTEKQSVFKMAFDTPESHMKRELSATVSFDLKNHNVTVVLHSVGNSLIAKGTYKRTENETFIEIGFDVNGTKHLDASIGYTTQKFTYGYIYNPKFYLDINSERVAAVSGEIRNTQKNNLSQCEIELIFQTKKVWSKLVGYIVKRNVSLDGDFQLNYQLQKMPKKETLHLEIMLSNRSTKTLAHKSANLKLHSTAYPQLNTVITAWYQQALGHLELHAEVNSSPHLQDERHKLVAQLIISYSRMYFQNQGTKVSALIAITKPIQHLDIKVGVNHYSSGIESKTSFLIGYAPEKEITLMVRTKMPRGLLFAIEGRVILTIPNFNSTVINVRITERSKREYELDFSGTWFSGHFLTALGMYIDRSSPASISHNLKLILKSSSFANDIIINSKLYQNTNDLEISIYVEQQDMDKYAFILNHTVLSIRQFTTYIEGRYKSNVYSILNNVDTEKEIKVEIHLDKWRDVHLTLTGINEEDKKEYSIELKWDANRDPASKFTSGLLLDKYYEPSSSLDNLPEQKLEAKVYLSYPGRSINSYCSLIIKDSYNYKINGIIQWNPDKTILLDIDFDYFTQKGVKSFKFKSQLSSPFDQWKKTALEANYFQIQKKVVTSGSVHWNDTQYIMGNFELYEREIHTDATEWLCNFGLSSTIHPFNWLTANITHLILSSNQMRDLIIIKYHPQKKIDIISDWILDAKSWNSFDLTGSILVNSPLINYNRCEIKSQLHVKPNRTLSGLITMDFDQRNYAGSLTGDFHRLKESYLKFLLTTPIEKYSKITANFGLSESQRHVVAEISIPNGTLGFEAICQLFTSSYDFNVLLSINTPIDILQRSLFVAKLNKEEADFRVAYNNMTAGFMGAWCYKNITDFNYSYKLFTPLYGLQESGVTAKLKLLYPELNETQQTSFLLDTEFSINLAEVKLGLFANVRPKQSPYDISTKMDTKINSNSDEDDEYEEDIQPYQGQFTVWPVIVEPVKLQIDFDLYGRDIYSVQGFLIIPPGQITFKDIFILDDMFYFKNDLHIKTPFNAAPEIFSTYILRVNMETSVHLMLMNFNIHYNKTSSITNEIMVNYTYNEDEYDWKSHMLKCNIETGLEFFKKMDIKATVNTNINSYKSTINLRTENSVIDFLGYFEAKDLFLDTSFILRVVSPALVIPKTKIILKKNFINKEKQFEFSTEIDEPIGRSSKVIAIWQVEDKNYKKVFVLLETWIELLKTLKFDALYINEKDVLQMNVTLTHNINQEYQFISSYNDDIVKSDIYTPLISQKHLHFDGHVSKVNNSLYILEGKLTNLEDSKVYNVLMNTFVERDTLTGFNLNLRPQENTTGINDINLILTCKTYELQFIANGRYFNASIGMNLINTLNWDIRAHGYDKINNTKYELTTFMNVQVNGNTTLYVHGSTPLKEIESLTLDGNIFLTNNSGDVKINHHLNDDHYYAALQWKLLYMLDMFGKVIAGYEINGHDTKDLNAKIFFKNPDKSFRNFDIGFDVDIDHDKWKFGSNASIGFRNHENIDAVFALRFPPPNNDDHRFLFSYHANKGIQDMSYVIGYNTVRGKTNYASDGSIRVAAQDIDGHLRLTWGMLPNQTANNLFNITFEKKEIELKYSLFTPKYLQEETLVLLFNYDGNSDRYNLIDVNLFLPARKRVGTAKISFESLTNVNGTINATTPIPNLSYVGCNFVVLTTLKQNKRYIEFFWPNNTAILNSDYTYQSVKLDSTLDGIFQLEIPLTTRHAVHLTYGYKKRPQITNGYSTLMYNQQKIIHADYNSKSQSRAGFEKDNIQINIENTFKPIGIIYVNQYEYSGGNEGTNYPTVEIKHVNVYQLNNVSAFNISGESRIKTTHTGQDIHLKAMHLNHTIQLMTNYKILSGEFDQYTWLSLAKDAWISYHVNILNKTTEEMDNQFIILDLAYPRRNFTLDGSYKITSDEINSEAKLEWDRDKERTRTIGVAFDWRNITSNKMLSHQETVLRFRHPSFAKDVTFKGELSKKDIRDLLNLAFVVDYSLNPDKLLEFAVMVKDESELPNDRKYVYSISGKHPKTELDLNVEGFFYKHKYVYVETENHGKYKRSFLPEETGQLSGRLNIEQNEVLFRRENNDDVKYFQVRYYPKYPEYIINGSIINTPDLNATGFFFLDPEDKFTWMMVNYTPDAVQSLRMYGKIPDARNAVFDIWRTYDDDFNVYDVTFYLKLNHSRLLTSTLKWRPELKSDITNTIKTTFSEMYENIYKDIDYWKQYIKSESISVVNQVWEDSQEELQEFLDDWNNLKQLETDFEDLKVYLNESYNTNEFYIKDIVTFAGYIIDELSLRSQLKSLPNIFNEIWEIMGESGEAIRNSLLWIIETMKKAYNKIIEIIGTILRGDSFARVADIVEKLIEKYDMIIKDIHVSFIRYVENLWDNISRTISQQWYKFLKNVEPLFIQLLHYLETMVWKVSKEVVDFLYNRKNEIISSPYFDRFSNLTQDIDKFYKDIKGNDIITNIEKYSGLVIQFLKERYFAFVPFGKELKDVIDEIIVELKELKKLPSVHYALDKMQQVYDKVNYFYNYFEIRVKIENVIRFAHAKLIDISQSALQAESRYREAKTKFIFDPNQGLMCLEQKLPMSWHAFNQTPEFHEISEYRMITDMGSYFVTSNTTFWSLYYHYKPYTEPSNWLPPFKAQAMIIGSRHFKTFDGLHFDLFGSCTYLLAHDFVKNTFAILIKYNQESDKLTHSIIVLIGKNEIEIDIFNNVVRLNSNASLESKSNLPLPIELDNGTTYVYQQENIVTIERKKDQLRLECNLKFDLCTLELSGWYYGKTAGLLGTMNNEKIDDSIMSSGIITKDINRFAQSWSTENSCKKKVYSPKKNEDTNERVTSFCKEIFVNQTSEFSSCFAILDPKEYAIMCLSSTTQSEACTIVIAYMQVCVFHNTYLRIPDRCTTCTMINNTQIAEGEFKKLEGDTVPKSTDIVFIVEAKECNRNIRQNRSIEQLVNQLNKELKDKGLTSNHWSLVTFGGRGVYDQPRNVILDGQVFTKNVMRFIDYFDHIPVSDGNQDIFAAIGFASQLVFRAGVSKTFILLPCSHCEPENQTLDYAVVHQVLLEHDIVLHILMDGDFEFEKEKLNKIFYGFDASKLYTKKDSRIFTGDTDLRKQVKSMKNVLGYCTPLSLETNGTIFSGDKLRFDKLVSIKKFVTVFSKRIALTAIPRSCQHCECTADNNGITKTECMPCVFPTPVTVDYETFNFNETLSAMQPFDLDYGQIDVEDD
ncbi:PREDICTED: uncharacterized protein LOC107064693 [Polistes dominula]|uniref:Uncharacterized protein LOC107064693 n=1 Tax=Polistes dominula TaxID=743375 RepID=A0ABM1HYX7_POLDO|nr:PREDICTED: uncharacterized protein LOC107064693 [Polistes dominula]